MRRPGRLALPRGRGGRAAALGLGYLALTALFVVTGFPYERIAPRVASTLEAATGARAAVGRVAPGLTLLGPQLRAYDVDLAWPGGPRVQLARARARPAWSLSWLSGEPSLALELRSDLFEFDGTVRLGEAPAVRGRLSGLALARLPEGALGPGVRADGRLDADVDLRAGAAPLPEGALSLHARDGSLSLPGVPIGIPFARLDGELVLGGDAQVVLDSLALDGPLGALRGQGRIGTGPDLESSPLALEVRLEAKEPALRQLLAAEGVTLGPDGGVDLAVGGTLGEPRIVPRTAAPPGPARRPP